MNGTGWISDQFNAIAPRGHGAAEEVAHAQTERRAARDLDARVAQARLPTRSGPTTAAWHAGPVGPLLMPASFWPQRPWNASQA